MKKVVMLVPSLESKGPIIIARDIALYSNNNILFIFIVLRKSNNKDLKICSNFKIYELELGKIPLFSLKLRKVIEELKPDIIHCHCFWPTILAGIYLKKFKVISTLHNNPLKDFYYEYGKILSIFMVKVMIFFQKRFYLNISISNYIQEVHKKLGLNNIVTIYNGVPKIEIFKKARKENKEEKLKLITVSVLNKIKNVSFLLKIVKSLREKNIKIELKIIGDGYERRKLEDYVRENKLEKEIIFLGKLERKKVYEELKQSDIFLFSSLNEGFGLVIVEALLCEIPVIASNIPIMKEIITNNKNGIICNLNIEEYTNAILEIYKNLDTFKSNTKKYFNENFLVENMSKNYETLYKKI